MGEARGQHEAVAAALQRFDELDHHVAQARETLEGPQFQHLVQQERGGLAVARAGAGEELQRFVERDREVSGAGAAVRRRASRRASG